MVAVWYSLLRIVDIQKRPMNTKKKVWKTHLDVVTRHKFGAKLIKTSLMLPLVCGYRQMKPLTMERNEFKYSRGHLSRDRNFSLTSSLIGICLICGCAL